jgi:ATP-binding cassette, subfamily B, multidrug efflux pump
LLDDCLSAVDAETEEAILHALKHEIRNKTSVIVSHRISALRHCDLILYMEEGRVAEQGTHNELLALKGKYWKLNQLQSH